MHTNGQGSVDRKLWAFIVAAAFLAQWIACAPAAGPPPIEASPAEVRTAEEAPVPEEEDGSVQGSDAAPSNSGEVVHPAVPGDISVAPVRAGPQEVSRGREARRIVVSGYYASDYPGDTRSFDSFAAHSDVIDQVVAFSHAVGPDGEISGSAEAQLMEAARREGKPVLALLHNCENGSFRADVVKKLLDDESARDRLVKNALDLVADFGYEGINLDIENVPPSRRDALSSLAAAMSRALGEKEKLFTVSIPAKTHDAPDHQWSGAFDYGALGEVSDQVMLMTYDQHYIYGPAGPIASIDWVRRVVEYASSAITPEKIYLGIAAYGYDWPDKGTASYLTSRSALRLAESKGAEILWDSKAQVPHFYHWNGSQRRHVYFENSYSAAFKLDLAIESSLAGVAIWRLGLEEPALWKTIAEKTR